MLAAGPLKLGVGWETMSRNFGDTAGSQKLACIEDSVCVPGQVVCQRVQRLGTFGADSAMGGK